MSPVPEAAARTATQTATRTATPTAAPTPDLAIEVHRALQHFIRSVQLRDRDRICCHDLSVVQSHLLDILAERGPMGMGALADALLHDRSTASRVSAGLEAKGWIRRDRADHDGRAIVVSLTPGGRALQQTIEHELLADEAELLAALPDELLPRLPELFRDLAHRTVARVEGEAHCCTPSNPDCTP